MNGEMNILRGLYEDKCKEVEILKSELIALENKPRIPQSTVDSKDLREEYEVKIVTLNQ